MINKLKNAAVALMCVTAGIASASLTSTDTQTVSAGVNESISLAVGSATATMSLTGGNNDSVNTYLVVSSSNPYTISAACDSDSAKTGFENYLWEYDTTATPAAYVSSGSKVNAPLNIAATAGTGATGSGPSATAIGTTAGTIFTGTTPVNAAHVDVALSVATPVGTAKLTTGHEYRMVITYTATTTGV